MIKPQAQTHFQIAIRRIFISPILVASTVASTVGSTVASTLASTVATTAIITTGCSSMHSNPNLTLMSRDETENAVDQFTVNQKVYDGFMNRLDISATLQNSKVTSALIDESARVYQWNPEQYEKEKAQKLQDMTKSTEVFLSFFVPERKEDDLHKKTTKWKFYLDVGGKRYEGKASRVKTQFSELMVLYPHHTRWGTPYRITFEVPVSQVETSQSKMTITGPPGASNLEFPAVR